MISDFLPKIDASKCIGCELCIKVCPNRVLAFADDVAIVAKPEACDYTGACQEICPSEAISLAYEIVVPKRGKEDTSIKENRDGFKWQDGGSF